MTDLEKIEARMASGEKFTFAQLWQPFGEPGYRVADRAIQRWRKAGLIAFTRGRETIWRLTPAGVTLFTPEGTPDVHS